MKVLIILQTFSLIACGQPANPRAKVLADAVARGDKALATGQPNQASAAWSLLLLFEPNHAEARKRIEEHPVAPRGPITPAGFDVMRRSVIRAISIPEELCGFPTTTSDMGLVNLRMISDARLLPDLETSPGPVSSAKCDSSDIFVFLGAPLSSMSEVRKAYGKPQDEAKESDGDEVLTYGRIRILGDKDGTALFVYLRRSNR